MSNGSIPFSNIWKPSPPNRASSRCHRLSPYPARSTDIGVVLDLMIHDLDVVLAFVKSPVTSVDAVGIPVLSKSRGHRERAPALCQRLRGQPDRQPGQPGADAEDSRVQWRQTTPSYISLDYRAQEGFIYRIARDDEEESSLLKKLLAAKLAWQGFHHCQPVRRQENRPRAGAHCEGRTAQAGAATFCGLRARETHARRQWRIRQTRTGFGF